MNNLSRKKTNTATMNEDDVASRVLANRARDCEKLGDAVVSKIVKKCWRECSNAPRNMKESLNQMQWLLQEYMSRARDENLVAAKRREAFENMRKLFKKIDENLKTLTAQKLGDRNSSGHQTSAPTSDKTAQHQQNGETSSLLSPNNDGSSSKRARTRPNAQQVTARPQSLSGDSPYSKKRSLSIMNKTSFQTQSTERTLSHPSRREGVPPPPLRPPPLRSPPPPLRPPPPRSPPRKSGPRIEAQECLNSTASSSTGENIKVGTRVSAVWCANGKEKGQNQWYEGFITKVNKEQPGSMHVSYDVAFDDGDFEASVQPQHIKVISLDRRTAQTLLADTEQGMPFSRNHSDARKSGLPVRSMPPTKTKVSILLLADSTPTFSNATKERPMMKLLFTPEEIAASALDRLYSGWREWEPFWSLSVENVVSSGLTSRLESPRGGQSDVLTGTQIQLTDNFAKRKGISADRWGKVRTSYDDKEKVLVLLMFPVNPNLKQRAPTHLWPKGTFLQIGGKPVRLEQRKQESHDGNLWKLMCKPLDVTAIISNPKKATKIQLGCYDRDQYMYCLAVCKYRSAETLFRRLMDPPPHNPSFFQRLSREESIEKAMEFMKNQTVILESDEDDEQEVRKLIFSLTCFNSGKLIQTPVRGRTCKHWQCFDLKVFLIRSESATGSRWRCPVCSTFLSWKNLQFCGLYADLLQEFKDTASSQRNCIEFRSDGTYTLLQEKKARFGREPSTRTSAGAHSASSFVSSTNAKRATRKAVPANDVIELD